MPISAQQHQAMHAEGLVYALACSAGLVATFPSYDLDGIDLTIGYPGVAGGMRSPQIAVQVKSWSNPQRDEHSWKYRLRSAHFNNLAGQGFTIPRYLVLVIVPPANSGFVECDRTGLTLRTAAYWASLAHLKPVEQQIPHQTVPVDVPLANLLTADSLVRLVRGER